MIFVIFQSSVVTTNVNILERKQSKRKFDEKQETQKIQPVCNEALWQ